MRGRPRTEQQTTPVNISPHRLRSHRRQLPSQKPPPHALQPIPDTVVNAEEPEEPEPIQVLPLPLLFPPIQTPMPCALQLISGTIANAEEHEEHFPVLPLPCLLGFVCPGSYTHTQTVENQSPLQVISAGDASHCSV